MLSNAYFLVKFRFDTAENELAKNLQNFANNLHLILKFPIFANFANHNLAPAERGPMPWSRAAGQFFRGSWHAAKRARFAIAVAFLAAVLSPAAASGGSEGS